MATFSRVHLSGSPQAGSPLAPTGRVIPISATATPGTLLHTAVAGASSYDELYLWVSNVTTSAVTLTVEFGGVTDPGDHLVKALVIGPNSPPYPVAVGQVLNAGLIVRAFANTANALNVSGYVNRIQ